MKEEGSADHQRFLVRALALAARGEGHTRPNPPVGAVIVSGGQIIGEGWHRKAGGDHAEVAAIKDACRRLRAPVDARCLPSDATLYVTLEPCSKPGRVGACTDAIVAAGIKRVYFAVPDPNRVNRGKAKRVLARRGVVCTSLASDRRLGAVIAAARRMIAPFAKHVTTGLPFVTVKLAMSLDGRICDCTGNAKWISSARSRGLTGRERERVDAIMVGAGTVRADDPSLLSHGRRNDDLVRVVVTRSGRIPKQARIFTDGRNPTLVCRAADGRLKPVLEDLGRRGLLHVLCEGGLELARSLADEGLVDRWISVTAPIVIGSRHLAEALKLKVRSSGYSDSRVGDRIGEYETPS